MLTKFAVTNYRGFAEKIEIDLTKYNNYEFNKFAISNEVIKNGIIYGPNGSGKTNLSLAIFDIEYHLAPLKAKKPDFYNNYVNVGSPEKLVEFEYTFKFKGNILRYNYAKDKAGQLRKEDLTINGDFVFARTDTEFKLNQTYIPNSDSAFSDNLKNGANNFSVVNLLLAYYPMPEGHFLLDIQQFVNKMLWFRNLDQREFIGIESQANGSIEEYIIKNGMVTEFANFLKDISAQEFSFSKSQSNDKVLWLEINQKKIPFFDVISTGTRSLALLFFWIKRMGDASFVFIDEFDAFYHFRLSYKVCKFLFALPCQLFLSSHNTYLMTNDLLRPDCNFILNENKLKSLSDCTDKELRFGHNIEKLFRGNAFNV